jgi:tyrosyl-tRNA synthetase
MSKTTFPPVDEQLQLLRRGAVDLVDEEQLTAKLKRSAKTGKPLTVKVGFDPTAPDLHIGHSVLLRKMRHFQQCGHRIIFLIGDFTALIGDPTGKKAARPQLSREEIEANAKTYTDQVFRILDPETTVVDYNSRWLLELGADGMVRLAGKYTLARMMERDDFRTRYQENQPIHMHELFYPLAQGYDSVALEADVELGGHDQIFNLLVGRHLMKEHQQEPQVVLTVPLLIGTDGTEKMSKSLGNFIALEDPAGEMYGKTLSIPDALMWDWLLLLTDIDEAALAAQKEQVESGALHPKAVKQALARELVTFYHGAEAARTAEGEFEKVFAGGGVPDDVPEVRLEGPLPVVKLLPVAQLAASGKEARRLIDQGAVSIDGERVSDPFLEISAAPEPYLFKVGKRRFARVTVG